MGMTVLAGAAVASLGFSVYTAMNQPDAPNLPPPPKPAGASDRNQDGDVTTKQTWNAETNSYVTYYNPRPERTDYASDTDYTAAINRWETRRDTEAKDNEVRTNLKNKALKNLDEGNPEREAQIKEYGKNFAAAMHTDVDERIKDAEQIDEENITHSGLLGSKAYAEMKAKQMETKGKIATDIAQKSEFAKENLRESDRNFWTNLLSSIDAKEKGDTLLQLERGKNLSNISGAGTAALMGGWNAQNNADLLKWEAKVKSNQEISRSGGTTASGLMYLYGLNKKDGTTGDAGNTDRYRGNYSGNFLR